MVCVEQCSDKKCQLSYHPSLHLHECFNGSFVSQFIVELDLLQQEEFEEHKVVPYVVSTMKILSFFSHDHLLKFGLTLTVLPPGMQTLHFALPSKCRLLECQKPNI